MLVGCRVRGVCRVGIAEGSFRELGGAKGAGTGRDDIDNPLGSVREPPRARWTLVCKSRCSPSNRGWALE
jgi:hypothetical protein